MRPPTSVYLDYNGSTPVDPAVRAAYFEALDSVVGNASAGHAAGQAAAQRIARARASVARGLGASAEEIWFTSGGTESNNWAVLETARVAGPGAHLVVSSIEHKSVLSAARRAQEGGAQVTFVDPGRDGRVDAASLERSLTPRTVLVALMLANNETGVLQPVAEVGRLCRARGVRLLCDAVAAAGKLALDVRDLKCDFLSLSAHKFYAPKGVGVLYVRSGVELTPFVVGCGQQCGMRGGTENTAGVAALGEAFERLACGAFDHRAIERLRDHLWRELQRRVPTARLNGAGERLPNTISVAFPGVDAAQLQRKLAERGVSVAAGAAASNGAPSHVLTAMGAPESVARATLRFSLGVGLDERALEHACDELQRALTELAPAGASPIARNE